MRRLTDHLVFKTLVVAFLLGCTAAMAGGPVLNLGNLFPFFADVRITTRVVTAAGAVTVLPRDKIIIINKATPEATVINYTCVAGMNFTVKDGAGNDLAYPITLTPVGTTLDAASTFVMNTSTPNVPPFDSRSVNCDGNLASWLQ